ncbi:hypothetical protein G6F16_013063 [Rhizopus arrhizus]|nr:hypothetical protein G6F24_014284 [Rhizopus arrhizus]KAG0771313.1 hypothetical protein G6F22_016587 [Rhizopus arrhizus]KAG0777992.1 hypothetical protein G6F21_013164 [Rhizopus arrhizus]KAG0803961.1 hypothetical protein G6F20_013074 [Rhizopus arrhizus]KAG0813139.1 hypothetical protein G6F19_013256 [Rhizopus arrhizus]
MCAKDFYENLYSPNPISQVDVESLMANIPTTARIDQSSHEALLSQWTIEEFQDCLSKASKQSSPGVDGIPYCILQLLFFQPFCRQLFMDVLHSALIEHRYPASWQRSVVVLLPKKGDRSNLKNWRPTVADKTGAQSLKLTLYLRHMSATFVAYTI